jgi:predicted kinase
MIVSVRLILLNGPPGCGKSTLAQAYADEHPLTLNLDVDRLRSLIGQWHDPAAGQLARSIALAAARVHLSSGHDVVVPQFLGRPEFIDALEQLAHDVGADFHEIVIMLEKSAAVRRFTDRTSAAADPAHLEAQQLLDTTGGIAELEAMHDRLTALLASRPHAHVIAMNASTPDQTYRDILRVLT